MDCPGILATLCQAMHSATQRERPGHQEATTQEVRMDTGV